MQYDDRFLWYIRLVRFSLHCISEACLLSCLVVYIQVLYCTYSGIVVEEEALQAHVPHFAMQYQAFSERLSHTYRSNKMWIRDLTEGWLSMSNQKEDYVHALLQCSNKISSEELSSLTFRELISNPQIYTLFIYLNKCEVFFFFLSIN